MYLFVKNYAGFAKGAKVKSLEKPLADDLKRNAVVEEIADTEETEVNSEKPKINKSKKK